jgi:uncharacterized protein YoxC
MFGKVTGFFKKKIEDMSEEELQERADKLKDDIARKMEEFNDLAASLQGKSGAEWKKIHKKMDENGKTSSKKRHELYTIEKQLKTYKLRF